MKFGKGTGWPVRRGRGQIEDEEGELSQMMMMGTVMEGVQLMGILLVGTSLKFGKGKGPAKKSKGSDDDDGDSDAGSTTNGDTSGRYIIEVW